MQEQPLVSIIIPTYNRAHLIGETLDSVLAQTYVHWECIVVDDGSRDMTATLIAAYISKDQRFHYYLRPLDRPKGANACRNYGLKLAKGEYINWFDSDDLMQPDFLYRKIEVMKHEKVDFVISKSLNFDEYVTYEVTKYKGNLVHQLSGKNYILKKVYWMTPDFFIKKECLKGYFFNESLHSGQETNFFIVFLNKINLNGVAIDEYLSLRRLHNSSIQQELKQSKPDAYCGKLISLLASYNCIFKEVDNETKSFMQVEIMSLLHKLEIQCVGSRSFFNFTGNLIHHRNPLKASAFLISMLLKSYFKTSYKLFEYSRS